MLEVRPGRCPIAPPHMRASQHLACSLPTLHPMCTPENSSATPLRTWQNAWDFNQPLDWDVAHVTNMQYMFKVRPGR